MSSPSIPQRPTADAHADGPRVATGTAHPPARPSSRDEFIDLVRAFSLLVVVLWHWVFTIVVQRPTGPYASSPLAYTDDLWILTWLLQVMPLFFFVGGYAHLQLWNKVRSAGGGYLVFLYGRAKRLLIPSLALLITWAVIAAIVQTLFNVPWFARAALLIVSPLWFIAVYLMLVVITPPAIWLHNKLGPVAVVVLTGIAGLVDVLRFGHGLGWLALINLVVVWALCHQLGFFYRRLADAPRTTAWSLAIGGLFGLVGLVLTNIYPPSMVGVPGDRFSNMGPPTLCIVALCFFQTGLLMLVRPWVLRRLERPAWARTSDVVNRFALPLFLFHSTGYALAFALLYLLGWHSPDTPTVGWWLQRPLWLLLPLACTIPVILLFGRKWVTTPPKQATGQRKELEPLVVMDSRW